MASGEGTIAVVAEKPSVGRDIAKVLGATTRGDGYLHGSGYVVTWAIGHLVALAQPHEINPEWRSWRADRLPMLPASWPLVVGDQTRQQFEVVRKILTSPRVATVICATDAGREGELIFRYIYEAAGCQKPFRRLWISSLTAEAIRDGFARLREGSEYNQLADAARGRSRADWLVGMNLSRAYTLACQEDLSVGRVQTPTLAMLVDRELAIRNFVSEDYYHVVATFSPRPGEKYEGTWFRPGVEPLDAAMKLAADGKEAAAIAERVRGGQARIERISAETRRIAPPALYDLTELQRHANRLYAFSAQRTLELAQALYERHKLISYPRTDSRHVSEDVARTLPRVVAAIAPHYEGLLAPGTGERPLGRRFVDDSKVSDHHAIIPTGVRDPGGALDGDERRIYDLVCRRLLAAWHPDHIALVTTVITLVTSGPSATSAPGKSRDGEGAVLDDRFHSSGTMVQQVGWKVLDIGGGKAQPKKSAKRSGPTGADGEGEGGGADEGQTLPPGLEQGQSQNILDSGRVAKKTRPPKRLNDATLLTAMETAGKTLDDKELSDAMKDNGLGTPATRAQIIEVLLKRGFIERKGKSFEATAKGIRLIEVVHPEVKSPAMTGQWEAYLKRIERGQAQLDPFIEGIEDYVREVVGKAGRGGVARPAPPSPEPGGDPRSSVETPPPAARLAASPASATRTPLTAAPATSVAVAAQPVPARAPVPWDGDLESALKARFGFDAFRPNQEAVCRAMLDRRDVLLVMPTGSGKSLCYQLPGVLSGGTTLVVSPLIALMEDQVAKLRALGFAAERIHSNRDRASSREVCFAYLEGKLDFLFIAPERLRVQGFPEMLAKRKPALVAIDEAHCISQWGHDFRPDYRNIGRHLPALRPAPVIALTATATPLVQGDIAAQLGLDTPKLFIHGFRRKNIAIEAVRVPNDSRSDLVVQILSADGRRPAIVYAPTRRQCESLAATLEGVLGRAEAYHAGLDGRRREYVQREFLEGRLEVVVATIAFGMGVDKPDVRTVIHTALPGSIEGYYQEIGRAGRDGAPSRAILMHAYNDRFTHDYFFERDYPAAEVLDRIYAQLNAEPQPKEVVSHRAKLAGEEFDTALEKLWIHGGAVVDYAENVTRGETEWRESYLYQREHKQAQFEKVMAYSETASCRMLSLVRYFGDSADSGLRCGVCDFCAPADAVGQQFRPPDAAGREAVEKILAALAAGRDTSAGRLYTQAFPDGSVDRRTFEELLVAMGRAGLVEVRDSVFEKDGKRIEFRKVYATRAGQEEGAAERVLIAEPQAATSARKTKPAKRKKGKKAATKAPSRAAASAAPEPPASADLLTAALKGWRLAEAKRRGVPAFRILTDKALLGITARQPRNESELVEVPGVGLRLAQKYGAQILKVITRVPRG
jgi:DNA topoisomerase III